MQTATLQPTKPAPYAEQARRLHHQAVSTLTSITIQQELLVECLEEDDTKGAEMCSKTIDVLAKRYAKIMQALVQPTIDKILDQCTD